MKLIIIGPQGSGKGTQCKKLSSQLGIPHISTGDILRENIKNQTPLGLKVKSILDSGKLVDDATIMELMKSRLAADDCKRGFILDGFPRTIAQAIGLNDVASVDVCVNLEIDFAILIDRLSKRRTCEKCGSISNLLFDAKAEKCGECNGKRIQRVDDTPDAIKVRLDAFVTQTAPLIDYYKAQKKLVSVDADNPIEQVFENILKVVNKK